MTEQRKDPAESETKELLQKLEIEAVLFDLDDTLIYTSELFIQYMWEYATAIAEKAGLESEKIMEALQAINDEEYKSMGVNPKRWTSVVEKLAKQFEEAEEEIVSNLGILMKIYTTGPRLREEARETLEIFRSTGVKMVLVTHANVEWTEFKLDSLDLWNYFDEIVIVDENGHKKSADWKRGMEAVGVEPVKCLVVGDSLGGDIRPGAELGARTVWMPSPWSVYREGEVPENTVVIDKIAELLESLTKLK